MAPEPIDYCTPTTKRTHAPKERVAIFLMWFFGGVGVAVPALVLTIASALLGHDDLVLARALFPIPMLLATASKSLSVLIIAIAVIQ